MGAFWSDGSIAPLEAPVMPPADNLTGKAVAGAVALAAVVTEPDRALEKQRHFVEQGLGIAKSGKSWEHN